MNDTIETTEMITPELTGVDEQKVTTTDEVETPVDQKELATYLSDTIKYDVIRDMLVKPLDVKMVTIKREVPIVKDVVKDDGLDINEYDETKIEEVQVPSAFREGIILKVPVDFCETFKVGDRIIYNGKFAISFDLLKDSQLVKPYDIIAKYTA